MPAIDSPRKLAAKSPDGLRVAPDETLARKERRESVRRGATWMLAGRIADFFLQAVYFVLLARLLGVKEYGIFAGVFALVNTVTPYSALGAAMLFMRYLAVRREEARVYWGNALLTLTCVTFLLALVVAVLGFGWHRIEHPAIALMLLLANCVFLQLTSLAGMLLFAIGDARPAVVLNLLTNLSRVLVALAMKLALDRASALQWSIGVLAGSLAAAVAAFAHISRRVGTPRFDPRLLRSRFAEGLGFSFAGTTEAINNDLDKVMLSYSGMAVQAGFYTLAYRVIDFATSPVGALTTAVMRRHFEIRAQDIRGVVALALKSVAVGCGVGGAIALAIPVLAPVVAAIAGRDFRAAILVLNALCWLPLIRAVHQMSGSAVTGLGYQNRRTAAQLVVALTNLGLNWMWIPRLGWRGAVWSTLASDGLLAILNVSILCLLVRGLCLKPAGEALAG